MKTKEKKIGLIVTGHGIFATGLTNSLRQIVGMPEDYVSIDYRENDSLEDISKKMIDALNVLKTCDEILVLCDLIGGVPFKTAVKISYSYQNLEVVGGVNLGMLIEINLTRTFVKNVEELAEVAIEIGKEQIARFHLSMEKKTIQIDITKKVHPVFGCTFVYRDYINFLNSAFRSSMLASFGLPGAQASA